MLELRSCRPARKSCFDGTPPVPCTTRPNRRNFVQDLPVALCSFASALTLATSAGILFHPSVAQAVELTPPQAVVCSIEGALQQDTPATKPNVLADVSALFGGDERDPIEAFTLYGTTFKKFVIEKLQGEKIVSRSRGFTVDTCVASIQQSQETPTFSGLPTGEKVRAAGNAICKHTEGSELKTTCFTSCESACTAGLERWEAENKDRTGFVLLDKDRTRLLKTCARECATDCTRPGKAYDFVIPYRK